jgi:hypothetical protein
VPGANSNSNANFNHMTGNIGYATTLFEAAVDSSNNSVVTPNGYTNPGQIISDSTTGGTFQMINDVSSTHNAWGDGNATNAITIPVGVFGVDTAYTMIQDLQGLDGDVINVTFNFNGNSGTVSANPANSVTFGLTEGSSGQVRASLICSTTTPGETAAQIQNCMNVQATTPQGLGSLTTSGGTVTTGTVFSTPYANTVAGSYFNGTEGLAVLDDQKFTFNGAFLNQYLVDIVITDTAPASAVMNPAMGTGGSNDKFNLSAVTVIGSAPEPSTYVLFTAGLAGLAALRKLRKRQTA